MKNSALPPLNSPAAYLRDALKKQYAGGGEGGKPPAEVAVLRPSFDERVQRLREEWQHHQSIRAKALFEEMLEGEKAGQIARFEDERLNELASPIAKAWRQDGARSRIAASSFFRWLSSSMWPGEVTDKQLLEFAMTREP